MNVRIAILLLFAIALAEPARADAIDGYWCHKDGRRMSINGPEIITPGGTSMEGEYERHGFAYKVPAHEPHAGARVTMTLKSDDIIQLFIPGKGPLPTPVTTETWQRCDLTM